jgi:hypothetical protein
MSTDASMSHMYESKRDRQRREAAAHNAAHPVTPYPIETNSENRKARRRMQMLTGAVKATHDVPHRYDDDCDDPTPAVLTRGAK